MSMSIKLSPVNLSGLMARMRMVPEEPPDHRKPYRVTLWRCVGCNELHEYRDDAVECCVVKLEAKPTDAEPSCPICGIAYVGHRSAADCCLWRDLPIQTRWAIADRVAGGVPWIEALEVGRAA